MSKKIGAAGIAVLCVLLGTVDCHAETTSGVVKVVTRPAGAAVAVAGKSYSPTPVLIELPVGKHKLVVTRAGYAPANKSVIVKKGMVVRADVELGATPGDDIRVHQTAEGGADAGPGTVTIATNPPGLRVFMGDLFVPQPTPVVFDIRAGIYELAIEQKGEVVFRKTVFVRTGRTLELDLTIRRRRRIDDTDPWQ